MDVTPEHMLSRANWVRGLALSLVGDPESAEDLAQDTWLAALRRDDPQPASRSWLATVMRNLVRRRHRDQGRRRRREQVAAQGELSPATDEVAARLELQRLLVDALASLREPYRTAIVLRYLEDRKPADIARRLGVPSETVRSRVRRGLELLRKELDTTSRERKWRHSAVVLFGCRLGGPETVSPAAASWIMGGAMLSLKLKLGLAALVIIGLSLIAWRLVDDGAPGTDPSSKSPVATGGQLPEAASPRQESAASAPVGSLPLRFEVVWSDTEEPVVGALLKLENSDGVVTGLTNDGGLVETSCPETWATAHLEIEHDGALPLSGRDIRLPHPGSVRIELMPFFSVGGMVTDAETGDPLEGAEVEVRFPDAVQAASSEDGTYQLDDLAARQHYVTAQRGGYRLEGKTVSITEPGRSQLNFSLHPTIEVEVLVVDKNEEPIEGAEVRPSSDPWGLDRSPDRYLTDAHGSVRAKGISALEPSRFSVSKKGYSDKLSPMGGVQVDRASSTGEIRIVLDEVGPTDRVVVGQVTDASGAPLSNVSVQWGAFLGPQKPTPAALSGADGWYRLEFQSEYAMCHIAAIAPSWAPAVRQGMTAGTPEEPGEVNLRMTRGHWLEGEVVDGSGVPIPGVKLRNAPRILSHLFPRMVAESETDSAGRFRLEGLSGLSVSVDIQPPRSTGLSSRSEELLVDRQVTLVLEGPGEFNGRVLDAVTGEPITNFTVRNLRGRSTWLEGQTEAVSHTSSSGSFSLTLEPGAEHHIYVEADGYLSGHASLVHASAADPLEQDILLSRGTAVAGAIVDARTNAPVPQASVTFGEWPGGKLQWDAWVRIRGYLRNYQHQETTEDGGFSFREAGPATLFVRAAGYRRLRLPPEARAAYADGSGFLAIPLERGETLSGLVVFGGHAVPGQNLLLMKVIEGHSVADGSEEVIVAQAQTDEDGRFGWDDLAPGTYDILVMRKSPAGRTTANYLVRRVTVRAGRHEVATVGDDLGELTLKGRLVDEEGHPADRVSLTLEPLFDWHYSRFQTWTFAHIDGRFHFRGLRPGAYRVTAEKGSGGREQTVSLPNVEISGDTERALVVPAGTWK